MTILDASVSYMLKKSSSSSGYSWYLFAGFWLFLFVFGMILLFYGSYRSANCVWKSCAAGLGALR